MTTHTIEIDGIIQRYHVYGRGPVCLMHPGGPGTTWEYLRMPEVEQHVTAVYIEPVGTPGADRLPQHPHGYTCARYAKAINRFLDDLDLPAVYLLGHAHGGFVVQHFALTDPSRLTGVILYDTAPLFGPELFAEAQSKFGDFLIRQAETPELQEILNVWDTVRTIGDDETMTRTVRTLFPAYFKDYWANEARFPATRADVGRPRVSGVNEARRPEMLDYRAALGRLSVPALVIVGLYDFICGTRWAMDLVDRIPDSVLVSLAESGHFGHIEQPSEFAEAIASFTR